jgi:hypothetical protein
MIYLQAPHHVEEGTSVHLFIWRITRFDYQVFIWRITMIYLLNSMSTAHLMRRVENTLTTFKLKYKKYSIKIQKHLQQSS